MATIRITQTIESETLHLPQLRSLLGRRVEITITVSPAAQTAETDPQLDRFPQRGSIVRDDDPFGPAAPEPWEATR